MHIFWIQEWTSYERHWSSWKAWGWDTRKQQRFAGGCQPFLGITLRTTWGLSLSFWWWRWGGVWRSWWSFLSILALVWGRELLQGTGTWSREMFTLSWIECCCGVTIGSIPNISKIFFHQWNLYMWFLASANQFSGSLIQIQEVGTNWIL